MISEKEIETMLEKEDNERKGILRTLRENITVWGQAHLKKKLNRCEARMDVIREILQIPDKRKL